MTTNREDCLTIVVVGLIALLTINFAGDYIFRGVQIEINEGFVEIDEAFNSNWETQIEINENHSKTHSIEVKIFEQLDKDVRANMRIIDQLIGILLRGEF